MSHRMKGPAGPSMVAPGKPLKTVSAPKDDATSKVRNQGTGYNRIGNLGDFAHPAKKKGRGK